VRQLRGWFAAAYFPSVDLQKLCDSCYDKGEMGLPRELIDEILCYNVNDLRTLKRCSLTSRTFYSAARPLIHSRMVLGVRSVVRGSPPGTPFSDDTHIYQAEAFHARYLSMAEERGLLRYGYVREVYLDLTQLTRPENVLQLRQLRALETVHTLCIDSLALHKIMPIFERCFSQFIPTLQSLRLLQTRCEDAHQLMKFICRFPHLDDLELTGSRGPDGSWMVVPPPGSKGPRQQQPLPFGGHLVLRGNAPVIQSLLDLPGGIHFRTIKVSIHQSVPARLLVACPPTLEVLEISCYDSRKSNTLTLTCRSTDGLPAG
jgi:hypothetical protein